MTVSTGLAAASGDEADFDVLESDEVREVLSAAGNPALGEKKTKVIPRGEGEDTIHVEVETELGTLVHAEYGEPILGESSGTNFTFHEQLDEHQQQLPRDFRNLPEGVELGLVHENGILRARRTATPDERQALIRAAGMDLNSVEVELAAYDNEVDAFYLIAGEEDAPQRHRISKSDGFDDGLHKSQVSELQSNHSEIEINVPGNEANVPEGEVRAAGSGCFRVFPPGPCTLCVGGTGACAGCSVACATIAGCAPCLLGCATTGGTCGCYLDCIDDYPGFC